MVNINQTKQKPVQNRTTVQQYPLEHRKIYKKFVVSMIGWTILLGMLMLITGILGFTAVPWLKTIFFILIALYITLFFVEMWYQTEYYNRYFYDITPDFLIIKKGVIMPHETMLPYEKLQDVYMDQDLFDRIFNLWDVHVSTATVMSGHEAHIDGVSRQNGEILREMILNKIRKEKKK